MADGVPSNLNERSQSAVRTFHHCSSYRPAICALEHLQMLTNVFAALLMTEKLQWQVTWSHRPAVPAVHGLAEEQGP